ncbi:PQQ-dependent sugar dehydrogenase [Aquabacterium sp. A7-Y]|uniref:PQQ-dependent sugar dehydrogenase n=1 Tax=Aquabacterium sp. A7-Y TaxID=1349605 RepID=UPI00223D83B3|nr:PQQ-dependent sugar dehydrogenase [Aquabacterium sp. A7-Y]MCW7536387.1 PQQ-dependent sugar dehydrogenase [Aquabacterium sp. A7-Y]
MCPRSVRPTLVPRLSRAALLTLALIAGAWPLSAAALKPVTVARGLQNPWGLAFLPDGRMLVTERPGRLRLVSPQGRLGPPLAGLPAIDAGGQGGLLDVAVDPRFKDNGWIYFSYSEAGEGGSGTAVARARLQGERLTELSVIFRQAPKYKGGNHFGSRLVFGRDGRLFVTLGDRFGPRQQAQELDNHLGKIVRIEADGRVPGDNPLVGKPPGRPEIWSWGHRNVQGAALHPQTGELWTHEHGPQGGDEVNIAERGKNYGWPVITYGREYGTGLRIGEGNTKAGMEQPLLHWVPSIAPSGMAFVTSERYPGWQGNLVVGALRAQVLVRLELDGRKVVREERLLQTLHERIRDVRQGPDGWLYILTDSEDGRIVRLQP